MELIFLLNIFQFSLWKFHQDDKELSFFSYVANFLLNEPGEVGKTNYKFRRWMKRTSTDEHSYKGLWKVWTEDKLDKNAHLLNPMHIDKLYWL